MKSMRLLYILMAFTLTPVVAIGDMVMGEIEGLFDNSYVSGYVCDRGSTDSLRYHVYVDGPAGVGQIIGSGLASKASDASVDSDCGHPGQDGNHGFRHTFSERIKQTYQGKLIYIHGIRRGIDNLSINGSGTYTVPAPSPDVVVPDPVEPGPVFPDPVDPDPIDPEPVDPEPIDDPTPSGLTFGSNVTINKIILWENSENYPLYFTRSDDVMCYIPAGEPTLQSLILTLYTSGNMADIHCHAEEEELMLGIRPAHKLHRIIAK